MAVHRPHTGADKALSRVARTRLAEAVPSVRRSRHSRTNRLGSTADTGGAKAPGAPRLQGEEIAQSGSRFTLAKHMDRFLDIPTAD
jgi:hypothetical protein